jgi:TatD DNase family protein
MSVMKCFATRIVQSPKIVPIPPQFSVDYFIGSCFEDCQFVDAHSHLQFDQLYNNIESILSRSRLAGVSSIAVCGVSPQSSDWSRVLELSHEFPDLIIPFLGLHPWWISSLSSSQLSENAWAAQLSTLLERYPQLHVGECGLDKGLVKPSNKCLMVCCDHPLQHGDAFTISPGVSMDNQEHILRIQLQLAKKYSRAVTIHCVGAWGRLWDILKDFIYCPSKLCDHGASEEEGSGEIPSIILHSCSSLSPAMLARFETLVPPDPPAPDPLQPPPSTASHPKKRPSTMLFYSLSCKALSPVRPPVKVTPVTEEEGGAAAAPAAAEAVLHLLSLIPPRRLLLETDSPDQYPSDLRHLHRATSAGALSCEASASTASTASTAPCSREPCSLDWVCDASSSFSPSSSPCNEPATVQRAYAHAALALGVDIRYLANLVRRNAQVAFSHPCGAIELPSKNHV